MTHEWKYGEEDELGFGDEIEEVVDPLLTNTPPPTEEVEEVELDENGNAKTKDFQINSEQEFVETFGDEVTETEEETTDVETNQSSSVIDAAYLKAKAKYKAEKYGLEFDDDQEFDEDSYAEFEDKLDDFRIQQRMDSIKTDPFWEAVFDIAENGGSVEDFLDFVNQRKELTEIDTSTPQGKLEKIKRYYKDVEGKSDAWINKQVRLIATGEDTKLLDEEYTLIESEYDRYFEEEKQRQVEEARAYKVARENALKKRIKDFETSLESKFDKSEVKDMVKFIYDDKRYKLQNSDETISAFDYKILEFKNNPEKLADLVLFLKDQQTYNDKIISKAKSVTNEKKFDKILKTEVNKSISKNTTGNNPVKKTKLNFNI